MSRDRRLNRQQDDSKDYIVKALDRGMMVLHNLKKSKEGKSLIDISTDLGIPKSTIFRLLKTLEKWQLAQLDKSTDTYKLGVGCIEISGTYLAYINLNSLTIPVLADLQRSTGETIHLGILNDMEVVYLHIETPIAPVGAMVARVGMRLPGYCTAIGKILLAWENRDEVLKHFQNNPPEKRAPNTLTSIQELNCEFDLIKKQGYAIDDEELSVGVRSVAVPLFDHNSVTIGAISVSSLRERLTGERVQTNILPLLIESADKISSLLGFRKQDKSQVY